MAFHISEYKEWQAGPGTPVKYSCQFELDCEMVEQTETTATFTLTGRVIVVNHPDNSRNSWPASDFAVLTLGGFDPIDYPFTEGVSYYQAPLPALPNAPQSYLNAMRMQFRGDTYRGGGPNAVSFWATDAGLLINAQTSDSTWTVSVNQRFSIQLTGNPYQEVLIYTHSGARNSSGYDWLQHDVWATLFNFDYRPGASLVNGQWQSHNRGAGASDIWTGSWSTMRTDNGAVGTDNPPFMLNNRWYNQRKIGLNG